MLRRLELLSVADIVRTIIVGPTFERGLFSTYATRYGAVFAMISSFFCVTVVVVGSAAAGREVRDELGRIGRGERPAEDGVRRPGPTGAEPAAVPPSGANLMGRIGSSALTCHA